MKQPGLQKQQRKNLKFYNIKWNLKELRWKDMDRSELA